MNLTSATDQFTKYLPVALNLWAQPNTRYAIIFLIAAGVLFVFTGGAKNRQGAQRQQTRAEDKPPLRVRRQPWHRRLKLWWIHKFDQPYYWKIGKWVANLNQTHGLVVGGSGSGKSTLVVQLILQPCISLFMRFMRKTGRWKRRPVLIISFDRSDPIEEATNVLEDRGIAVTRWRVRQANGWDMLQGDIEMIAEALPEGWPHGDNTGFFQQLATDAISAALHEQDDANVPRDFENMIERMDRIMDDDPETPDLARRTWVRRFRSLARVMGESIGNDFDLVSALQPEAVIHLSSNSYTNPSLTPLVGAMAITHAKLAAECVEGGGYLVLEEASFLKKRSDLLDDVAKSMRARGWRVLYLNQDPCSVGDALQVNFGVAVFMGLGPLAVKAREWCASVVKEFPGAFRAAELVLGATIDQLEGYVLINGRCRDVSIAPYITRAAESRAARRTGPDRPVSAPEPVIPPSASIPSASISKQEVRAPDAEPDRPLIYGPVAMPACYNGEHVPDEYRAQLEKIWLNHTDLGGFPGGLNGCYESGYARNNRGRPRCSLLGADWTTYILIRTLEDARLRGFTPEQTLGFMAEVKLKTGGGELTVDHVEGCENEVCDRPDHLAWEGRGRNSELYHERKREAAAA